MMNFSIGIAHESLNLGIPRKVIIVPIVKIGEGTKLLKINVMKTFVQVKNYLLINHLYGRLDNSVFQERGIHIMGLFEALCRKERLIFNAYSRAMNIDGYVYWVSEARKFKQWYLSDDSESPYDTILPNGWCA